MSVRSEKAAPLNASEQMQKEISEAMPADANLHEGAAYQTASSENPLRRTVVVSVRSTLNELCLSKAKGTWAPSSEALKSIRECHAHAHAHGPHPLLIPCTRFSSSQCSRRSTLPSTARPRFRAT